MTTTTETRIATAHIGTGAATHAIARRYTRTLTDGYTLERVNLMCGADRRDPLAVSEFPPAEADAVTCARCRAAMQKRPGLALTVDVEVEAAEEAEAPETPAAEAPEAEVPAAERRTTARRRPAGAPRLQRVANPARAAAKAERAAVVAKEWRAIREEGQAETAGAPERKAHAVQGAAPQQQDLASDAQHPAQIIGRNAKARRQALGLSAMEAGARLAPLLGKTWPRQTVYMAESGARAFTADDLTALAVALETTVADLMDPRGAAVTLTSGAEVPPSTWQAPAAGVSSDAAQAARQIIQSARVALDRASAHLGGLR